MKKQKQKNEVYEVYNLIWSNIRRYQYLNRLSDEQLSEALGISTRTLYTYDKNPSGLTLQKVQQFLDCSGMDILDLIGC